MSLIDKASSSIKGYFDRKAKEREFQEQLELEARENEKLIYKQEFKKAAMKAAMIRARKDAENKTGLAKLRAINQMSMKPQGNKGNLFTKLSEYTRANKARTEENIQRTQALRKAAMEDRMKKLPTNQNLRSRGSLY